MLERNKIFQAATQPQHNSHVSVPLSLAREKTCMTHDMQDAEL